jgi:hypothetical protein
MRVLWLRCGTNRDAARVRANDGNCVRDYTSKNLDYDFYYLSDGDGIRQPPLVDRRPNRRVEFHMLD